MVTIKEITREQIGILLPVIRQSFATVARDFLLTRENCPTNGAFIGQERLDSDIAKGAVFYGLYENCVLVGCVGIKPKGDGVYEMEKLAVLPEHRHRGYGTALLNFVYDTILQSGGGKVIIGVIYENIQLIKWYMNNGFIETSTKTFAHLPFTVSFMEKELRYYGESN